MILNSDVLLIKHGYSMFENAQISLQKFPAVMLLLFIDNSKDK